MQATTTNCKGWVAEAQRAGVDWDLWRPPKQRLRSMNAGNNMQDVAGVS